MRSIFGFLSIFIISATFAQPGTLDMSFNLGDIGYGTGDGSNNPINTIAVQADGKILAGGMFTRYNGTAVERIMRLNPDGSLDHNFVTGTGFSNTVYGIILQPNGKIVVGGRFSSYNGTQANCIARLNADGSTDNSFNAGNGFGGVNDFSIYVLALQTDGKIIVGGTFSSYNGTNARRIARLNSDGTLDNEFNTGTGFNQEVNNNSIGVWSLAVQSDGKILVSGNFTNYNGTQVNGFVRLNPDGTLDNTFQTGSGFIRSDSSAGIASALIVQPDGKILAGGTFNAYSGSSANSLIRVLTDGSPDPAFETGTGLGLTGEVRSLALQTDGRIIAGGTFTDYAGNPVSGIVRINSDGSFDADFNTGEGFNGYVQTLAIQSDGRILASGGFSGYNQTPANYIVRVNQDGSRDFDFNKGTAINGIFAVNSQVVGDIEILQDGKVLVGGTFDRYDHYTAAGIMRLFPDGTLDQSLNTGSGIPGSVWTVSSQADGKILVGGGFTSYNGISANRIARLNQDGSHDAGFNPGTGFSSTVRTLVQQSDGKILAGGEFTTYNDIQANRIIRLNPDGSVDDNFNIAQGFTGSLRSIVLQPDGKILAGGLFTGFNGATANRIIRLNANGTPDAGFITGTGFNQAVLDLVVQNDGKIIAGGVFTSYNGTPVNRIVRLNPDGSLDPSFNIGEGFNNYVRSLALQDNGKILTVGEFDSYRGITVNHIARLNTDGTLDQGFSSGEGFNDVAFSVAVQSDGNIIVGGNFTGFDGTGRNRIARIVGDPVIISTMSDYSVENRFIIYPNPVTDIISIDSKGREILSMTVYNIQGRRVGYSNQGNGVINVSGLPEGFYLVKVETESHNEELRFIKK